MIFWFLPGQIKRGSFKPLPHPSVRKFYKADTAASRPGIPLGQSQPPDDHKIHAFHVAHTRKSARTHKSRLTKWPTGWSVFLQLFDIERNICQPAPLEAGWQNLHVFEKQTKKCQPDFVNQFGVWLTNFIDVFEKQTKKCQPALVQLNLGALGQILPMCLKMK